MLLCPQEGDVTGLLGPDGTIPYDADVVPGVETAAQVVELYAKYGQDCPIKFFYCLRRVLGAAGSPWAACASVRCTHIGTHYMSAACHMLWYYVAATVRLSVQDRSTWLLHASAIASEPCIRTACQQELKNSSFDGVASPIIEPSQAQSQALPNPLLVVADLV